MSEDTHTPPICEACEAAADLPDVTVTIPGPLADALVMHGQELIDTLRRKQRLARLDSAAERELRARELAAHQAKMDRAAVQAFRGWRRIEASTPDQNERMRMLNGLCRELALRFGSTFSREWTRELIRRRRAAVRAYQDRRRVRTLAGMYLAGRRNGEIAARLGTSKAYVSNLLRKHRPEIEAARRELRT